MEILTPSTVKVTLFGNKVLVEDQVKRKVVGWALMQGQGESHVKMKAGIKAVRLHPTTQGTGDNWK